VIYKYQWRVPREIEQVPEGKGNTCTCCTTFISLYISLPRDNLVGLIKQLVHFPFFSLLVLLPLSISYPPASLLFEILSNQPIHWFRFLHTFP
jgi:hypothetical protein